MDSISSVTFQYVSGTVDAGSCERDLKIMQKKRRFRCGLQLPSLQREMS